MNKKSIEKEIIEKYVKKDKQDRILWELNNAKKREKVIWKFAGPDILKSACLQKVKYKSIEEMEKLLLELGGAKDIYFVGESYIGELKLLQALKLANMGEICIIYCGNGIGYYQGEQEQGSPPRFLLFQMK